MFVCGHPRHNAQGITNLNIIMLIKFMTSKRLPSSLTGNIIVRGVHHAVKISNDSLGCLSHHTARIRQLIKTAMLVQKNRRVHGHCNTWLLSLLLPGWWRRCCPTRLSVARVGPLDLA
ncbi:TPA: hypothetical protein ACH3X1_006373 [Trebouxia sp. C0004]